MTARRAFPIPRPLQVLLAGAVAAAGLTGCAEQGGTSTNASAGGTEVQYGASKDAYVDALADMDPITLTMQSTAPKGGPTGKRFEDYAAAVEEWSGGKITFDVIFSNGIAPPAEVDNALADRRIDVGSVMPSLEPSEFPVANALWDLAFVGRQSPVEGQLQWHGAMIQTAAGLDELYEEYESKGMKLVLPAFAAGSLMVECADHGTGLDELESRDIAVSSQMQNVQATALGMNPVSANYAEMFESLERGVVDCTMGSFNVSQLGGFLPAAPNFAYDLETGIQSPGGSIAFGLDRWNSLPLPAQQLLYDRMDVLLGANLEATWQITAEGVVAVEEAGGEIGSLDEDAVDALRAANEKALEDARSSAPVDDPEGFVDALLENTDAWGEEVSEFGIDAVDVSYDDFGTWRDAGAPDLQSFFDALWERALDERRPS